jgi:superfamily II DNA or RNA helicase
MIQTLAMTFKIAKFKDEAVDKTKYQLIFDTCKNAEVFIGDEIHSMVDGDIWNKVHAYFTNAIYRLGFSATPYQRLSTELLLEAAFGPIRIDISCSELIKKGFLTRPDVYVVKFKQPRLPGGTTYQEAYRDRISENEDRNLLITKIASKCWKNNLRVFVAITHLKQGKFLKQMLEKVIGDGSVVFIEGIMDVEKRQQAIKDMEYGKLRMVIGSRCMNEGVNIKSMQVLISARAGISKIEYIQTIGRALRLHPDKAKATIFDIQDYGCKYFGAHSMERMEVLLTEPEFNIKVIESDKV